MRIFKAIQEKPKYNMGYVFFLCIILGLLFTVIALFVSHGEIWSEIFHHDSLDTGMDFFHSIEYVRGRVPYEVFHTLYPPLANVLFYILYRFVPEHIIAHWPDSYEESVSIRGTATDLRVWQPTALMFILFILLTSALLIYIIQSYFKYGKESFIIAVATIFSYGMLYAYERGNIIIISFICSMFFVFYRDSSNKIISELALILLAIAAGLKLYPAFLGILLLYDKQFKKAFRTILYGILFFLLPIFAFHERINGLKIFFVTLLSSTNVKTLSNATKGFSFTQIFSSIIVLAHKILDINMDEPFLLWLLPKISLILVIILLIGGFWMHKEWQKILASTLAMILLSQQGNYMVVFLMIPLLSMIKNENTINRTNLFPFSVIVFSQMTLPFVGNIFNFWNSTHLRLQICLLFSVGYLAYCICHQQNFHIKSI